MAYLDGAETVDELIFQALGAVSMMWDYPDAAGNFHVGPAVELGVELKNRLGLEDS